MHDWYMAASNEGVDAIVAKIPKEIFNTDVDVCTILSFEELHRMYRLGRMEINFITLWCL